MTIAETFNQKFPEAVVTSKKNKDGDTIVYVDGQTAFNKDSRWQGDTWMVCMENAMNRAKN
jgi:hypothetical protein